VRGHSNRDSRQRLHSNRDHRQHRYSIRSKRNIRPRPHRDSTARHRTATAAATAQHRTSSSPASDASPHRPASSLAREQPRAPKLNQSAFNTSHPSSATTVGNPDQDAIWWRPRPSSVRATARTCLAGRSPAVGEGWGLLRLPGSRPPTTRRVTTSDDVIGRKARVGLKGAGGLVREPNETLESFALQNSRSIPDRFDRAAYDKLDRVHHGNRSNRLVTNHTTKVHTNMHIQNPFQQRLCRIVRKPSV
jgi:hypothetical protein